LAPRRLPETILLEAITDPKINTFRQWIAAIKTNVFTKRTSILKREDLLRVIDVLIEVWSRSILAEPLHDKKTLLGQMCLAMMPGMT
jgi:hypothetical protein